MITIGIINSVMFGATTEPGEHVDWATPDFDTESSWASLLGLSVAEYAEQNPHMIVFVAERCSCAQHDDGSVTTMLCPTHAAQDPCLTMAQVTGRRRTGSIRRGTCTNCGHRS